MITGMNLAAATAVRFGTANAVRFKVMSASSITAVSPAGTDTVNVTVTTPGGTSAITTADQFTDATPGEWTIFPTPSLGAGEQRLNGISCLSVRFCIAVGHNGVPGEEELIDAWDGSAWSTVGAPPTSRENTNYALNGVSCASARFCVAVGTGHHEGPSPDSSGNFPIIDAWNGATWSQVEPVPIQGDKNELGRVSCASSSFCVAVGTHGTEIGDEPEGLVESWNGKTWSLLPRLQVGENFTNELTSVSCVSSTFCVAVGSSDFKLKALVESWNGTEWSVVPSPEPGGQRVVLNGVSCADAEHCVAVGADVAGALVESFNGSTWSIIKIPRPAVSQLDGVSCVSAGSCAAVGTQNSTNEGPAQTLVETAKGGPASIVASANGAAGPTVLEGVTCLSAGPGWKPCFGVGRDEATAEGPFQSLVELGEI